MVIDRLDFATRYKSLHPLLEHAFLFLQNTNINQLPVGRYDIDGERVYAIVQEYKTKPQEEGFLETHKKYIDVQYVVKGSEIMVYAPLTDQKIQTPYDEKRDIAFYYGSGSACLLASGLFAILYPEDAHMPSRLIDGQAASVKKIVVKVLV